MIMMTEMMMLTKMMMMITMMTIIYNVLTSNIPLKRRDHRA